MRRSLLARVTALGARLAVAPRVAVLAVGLVIVTPRIASAQIEAGQVVDDSLHTPLAQTLVSLHRLDNGTWRLVDSARTDDRGYFQFRPAEPGVFRVGVLGTTQPQFAGGVDTLAADSVNERMLLVPLLRSLRTVLSRLYFEFEVQKPAAAVDASRTPVYPRALIARRIEGEVDAQFVVDTDGSVDLRTFKLLRPERDEFVDAVRNYLVTAHYLPARVADHPVRQVVQQKFMFNVN